MMHIGKKHKDNPDALRMLKERVRESDRERHKNRKTNKTNQSTTQVANNKK
jgi:hypothetical protein